MSPPGAFCFHGIDIYMFELSATGLYPIPERVSPGEPVRRDCHPIDFPSRATIKGKRALTIHLGALREGSGGQGDEEEEKSVHQWLGVMHSDPATTFADQNHWAHPREFLPQSAR